MLANSSFLFNKAFMGKYYLLLSKININII